MKETTSSLYRYKKDTAEMSSSLRTGSSVPFSSCHLPTRNACTVSMELVFWTCIQNTPFSTQSSSLSSPSCDEWDESVHRIPTVSVRNVSVPWRMFSSWQLCTASPCEGCVCGISFPCRTFFWFLGCSPCWMWTVIFSYEKLYELL